MSASIYRAIGRVIFSLVLLSSVYMRVYFPQMFLKEIEGNYQYYQVSLRDLGLGINIPDLSHVISTTNIDAWNSLVYSLWDCHFLSVCSMLAAGRQQHCRISAYILLFGLTLFRTPFIQCKKGTKLKQYLFQLLTSQSCSFNWDCVFVYIWRLSAKKAFF
jgi:hypothetical protein